MRLNTKDYFNAADATYTPNKHNEKQIQKVTACMNESWTDWPESYIYRGTCYLYRGDFSKATEDANKAISSALHGSKLFRAYLFRGNVHYAMQNYKKAIDDYKTALIDYVAASSYMEAICCYNLMYAYYKSGHIALAINALEEAFHARISLDDTQRTKTKNLLLEMLSRIDEHTHLDDIKSIDLFCSIKRLPPADQLMFLQQSIIPTTPFGKKMHNLQEAILKHLQKLGCDTSAFHHANVSVTTVGMYPNLTAVSKSKIKKITSDELFTHQDVSAAHNSL
jgi:tetratricopeptide (TPR) repeat protein